jgi:YesN/AraC family two-component response regulator
VKKPVVLVVDDEKAVCSMLVSFLNTRFDCEFLQANDGDEAIASLKNASCDIVLLDIKMPKKSGMTVLKEAKQISPGTDILIVSAWVSEDVAEEAIKCGATDYVVKPVDLKALSLKLKNILDKRGQLKRKD